MHPFGQYSGPREIEPPREDGGCEGGSWRHVPGGLGVPWGKNEGCREFIATRFEVPAGRGDKLGVGAAQVVVAAAAVEGE